VWGTLSPTSFVAKEHAHGRAGLPERQATVPNAARWEAISDAMHLDLNRLLETLRAGLHDEVPNFGALRAALRLAPPDHALARDYLMEAAQRGLAAPKDARGWRVAALASWFAPQDPRAPTLAQLDEAWTRARGFDNPATLLDWTALIRAQRATAREACRAALVGASFFLLHPTNEPLLPAILSALALCALTDDERAAALLCAGLRGAAPWDAHAATIELAGQPLPPSDPLSALWRELERRLHRSGQPYLTNLTTGSSIPRRWDMFGPREDFARAASVCAALGELTKHRAEWTPDAPKLLAQRLEREALEALRLLGVLVRRPSPALPWSVERAQPQPEAALALGLPQVLAASESLAALGEHPTSQRLAAVALGLLTHEHDPYALWARRLAYPMTPRT
jgi:hypothetical protein